VLPSETSEPPISNEADREVNGQRFLTFDHEVRVSGRQVESYVRWARRITNEMGLQGASQINIEFDATFQRLVLHSAIVRRGSETINQLDPKAIKLVQRESKLEKQIYDGRQSAILFLNDLRVGDVIEYAFSLIGADPTLSGKYADQFLLGAPFPTDRLSVRLVMPGDRPVTIVLRGPAQSDAAFRPAERTLGSSIEYRWDVRATKAYTADQRSEEHTSELQSHA